MSTTPKARSNEPDYTITIIHEQEGWVVHEGAVTISRPFEDQASAEQWAELHRGWYQPRCCICGSAESRADDPWECYSVDSYGLDWMHQSCWQKFEHWADNNKPSEPGPHLVPKMEVLDAAWCRRQR